MRNPLVSSRYLTTDENASPDDVISIIMKATGIDDDDADIKERIMASMPGEKTFHSLSLEKKCILFRFIFGHSYFHGLFDDFLEKVCPFTCPVGSPADNSVPQGGCCETNAQCYGYASKSTLLPPFLIFIVSFAFLLTQNICCIKQLNRLRRHW